MDEKVWDDPFTFRPERHLEENGKLKKKDLTTPFGLGGQAFYGCMWVFVSPFSPVTKPNSYSKPTHAARVVQIRTVDTNLKLHFFIVY